MSSFDPIAKKWVKRQKNGSKEDESRLFRARKHVSVGRNDVKKALVIAKLGENTLLHFFDKEKGEKLTRSVKYISWLGERKSMIERTVSRGNEL